MPKGTQAAAKAGEHGPTQRDVLAEFNRIGAILRAVTDKHIALLNDAQRKIVGDFLAEQSLRYLAPNLAALEGKDA